MGKVHERTDDRLGSFIEAQQVFSVGTAPAGRDGHVNVSPKGSADTFRVVGLHDVERVSSSCGYALPLPEPVSERDLLVSTDGLPAFDDDPDVTRG